jgi:hypothetical protein
MGLIEVEKLKIEGPPAGSEGGPSPHRAVIEGPSSMAPPEEIARAAGEMARELEPDPEIASQDTTSAPSYPQPGEDA